MAAAAGPRRGKRARRSRGDRACRAPGGYQANRRSADATILQLALDPSTCAAGRLRWLVPIHPRTSGERVLERPLEPTATTERSSIVTTGTSRAARASAAARALRPAFHGPTKRSELARSVFQFSTASERDYCIVFRHTRRLQTSSWPNGRQCSDLHHVDLELRVNVNLPRARCELPS